MLGIYSVPAEVHVYANDAGEARADARKLAQEINRGSASTLHIDITRSPELIEPDEQES